MAPNFMYFRSVAIVSTAALFVSTSLLHVNVAASPIADSFEYPLQEAWVIEFGKGDYSSQFGGYHTGEDIIADGEWPVYAAANGIVKHTATRDRYGNVVIIEHLLPDGNFVASVSGHMRPDIRVSVGQTVTKGQLIGYLASKYSENGGYPFTHLHFGIRTGEYNTSLDPDGQFRYRGYATKNIVDTYWYSPNEFIDSRQNVTPPPPTSPNCSSTVEGLNISTGQTFTCDIPENLLIKNSNVQAGGSMSLKGLSVTLEPYFTAEVGSSVLVETR
jgi:murein DD-endopeptidase MepM/ murein hydrolase activator NlpD